jgi:hypothetical protein
MPARATMTPTQVTNRFRRPRLAVQALEDRCTPASFTYAPATQTLTIVAANHEQIEVATLPMSPAGYVYVEDGAVPIFDSADLAQPVRNLIVRFDQVDDGKLFLDDSLILSGGVAVYGARKFQYASSRADLGRNFTYIASPTAVDEVLFHEETEIGGNVKLAMRAGNNTLKLRGGVIRGNLLVSGGADGDIVELAESSDVSVRGSAFITLGGGPNEVRGVGANAFVVRKPLTYRGGAQVDRIDFATGGTSLIVGDSFVARVGDAEKDAANEIELRWANIYGDFAIHGGRDADIVRLALLDVDGDLRAYLGDGLNELRLNGSQHFSDTIGKNLIYRGGNGNDRVSLQGTRVYDDVDIKMGDNNSSALQSVFMVGAYSPVFVGGTLKIVGGRGLDGMYLHSLYVFNGMSIETGEGGDVVDINDAEVIGRSSISLGSGNDWLEIEQKPGWEGTSTFGGAFRVNAGSGDDLVELSMDLDPTTSIFFGAKVTLRGGDGDDWLENGASYAVTGNYHDFEHLVGNPML